MTTELEILISKLDLARSLETHHKQVLEQAQEALYAAQDKIRDLEHQHYLLTRTARQKREDEKQAARDTEWAEKRKREINWNDLTPGMQIVDGGDEAFIMTVKRVNRHSKSARYDARRISSITVTMPDGTTDKLDSGPFYTPLETEAPRKPIRPVSCARCDKVVEYGELDERDLCHACLMELAEEA